MPNMLFPRRDFSWVVGKSPAAALAAPHLRVASEGRHSEPAPEDSIHFNFNESPYGPSPKALEALGSCGRVAGRYPDAAYFRLLDALAEALGVKRENILLGCGSSEVLRVADAAFLAPGENVVVAEPTFEAVLEYAKVMQSQPIRAPLTEGHRHDHARMAASCTSKTGGRLCL